MQRPGWYEHQAAVAREKRAFEPSDGEDVHLEPKRPKVPALASVIVEALKVDSLQKICSSLEPILRRVVSEEVERALAKIGPAKIGGRSSPKRIEGHDGRNLQLHFRTKLSLPLFTGGKVEGEQGAAIHVVLVEAYTGKIVTTGPESSLKLDVLVLEGDFNKEDDEDWTEEEFESQVVKEREGKRPLLTGDLQVSLKEGVGTLGELTFTDNSSWIRSRKFRLGLKVASGFYEGNRIREAKTEAFTVKDHRGELYKKHYPPALKDEVWRLEKIGKDGSFHKKLNKYRIYTVEDFLKLVVRDPQRLRNILGSGMSNKMWENLVEHAKTCVLSGKFYIYYDETKSIGAIFNNIYEFRGLVAGVQFFSAENLTESQKLFADTLVKKAYDNWMHVIEYDGKVLLELTKDNQANPPSGSTNNATSFDQQVSHIQSQAPNLLEQSSVDTRATTEGAAASAGYSGNSVLRISISSHNVMPNDHMEFAISSIMSQNQFAGHIHPNQATINNSTGLAVAGQQSTSTQFRPLLQPMQHSDLSTYRDSQSLEDYFSEEEIRMRSHELLENEDMQHLLRVFSAGGNSASLPEEGYGFPSYTPSPFPNLRFDYDRNRTSSGKAVVGWLKIKAAMRWGIFVRKKAAERRRAAQIVELDDD